MRETAPVPEDIIVRRVQRRLERYLTDLEKSKINAAEPAFAKESASTKIVSVPVQEKKESLPPPPPTFTPPPPPPPVPSKRNLEEPARELPIESLPFPPVSNSDAKIAGSASVSQAPAFNNSAKEEESKANFSDFPESQISFDEEPQPQKANSSFLPIFVFFLAFVAALGVLLGWYLFSGGDINSLAP